MSNADKKIKELGYEIAKYDELSQYVIYENKADDQRVEIQWHEEDPDECIIFSSTLSTETDWLGNDYNEPMGLTMREASAFLEKLQELVGS